MEIQRRSSQNRLMPSRHQEERLLVSKNNKIAIKVINHYGDEVLKVYEVK